MNSPKIDDSMAAPIPSTAPSRLFMIVLFSGAIIIGAVITYLGINGMIGGPIP
jgi:hypothetical protein